MAQLVILEMLYMFHLLKTPTSIFHYSMHITESAWMLIYGPYSSLLPETYNDPRRWSLPFISIFLTTMGPYLNHTYCDMTWWNCSSSHPIPHILPLQRSFFLSLLQFYMCYLDDSSKKPSIFFPFSGTEMILYNSTLCFSSSYSQMTEACNLGIKISLTYRWAAVTQQC